tara:strand:+ start:11171 stop:12295 length:1125 start_codon:yes stop_codon:yes gene_type:complete
MTLSQTTYSVPGTPRVYIDNLLYGRAMGVPFELPTLTAKINSSTSDLSISALTGVDPRLLWDLDPVRPSTINFSALSDYEDDIYQIYSKLRFEDSGDEFQKLVSSSNYAAVLGHNLNTASEAALQVKPWGRESEGLNSDYLSPYTSIVGTFDEDVSSDGFIIAQTTPDYDAYDQFAMRIELGGVSNFSLDTILSIGSFSIGTYLDFPHSPDIEFKQSIEYDGISTARTLAGKDLTNIRHTGSPNWGNLPPFTNSQADAYEYKGTQFTGRKSWSMKFSYIDKTDMFNAIMSGNSGGSSWRLLNIDGVNFSVGMKKEESIIGTYLSRTLGGSLKHIFQPDNTKDEFYLVKLDQSSISIDQVSPGIFDVSLKFVQVW